jgi:hypothetical protein
MSHPWVVAWLIALVGAEVKHLLHGPFDDEVAVDPPLIDGSSSDRGNAL